MIRPDFYAVLGVAPAASAEEIRQAYYQLARQHHPDAGASDADAERFKIINEAYRVLSTPQLRVAYDNALLMMGQHQANQTSQSGRARPVDSAPLTRTQTTAPVMPSVFPSLGLQVTLGQQRILPLREMTRCYLLTELGPLSEPAIIDPQPLDLALLVDRSSSMRGAKIFEAIRALQSILDQLHMDDLLTIVLFDDFAEVIADGETPRGRPGIEEALKGVMVRGSTELAKGLETTLDRLAAHRSHSRAASLVLLTDGHTYGDEQRCLELAAKAREIGVSITTLGLGVDWNRSLLDRLAAISGGSANYVQQPADLTEHFEAVVRRLRATLALSIRQTFEPAPGVRITRATRVSPDIAQAFSVPTGQLSLDTGSSDPLTVELGALAGRPDLETAAVLWETLLDPRQITTNHQGAYQVGRLHATYISTQHNHQVERLGQEIAIPVNTGGATEPFNDDVRLALQIVTAYRCQAQADTLAQTGKPAEAQAQLDTAALRLRNAGSPDLAAQAQQAAQTLSGALAKNDMQNDMQVVEEMLRVRYGTKNLGLFHRLRQSAKHKP